MVSISLERPFPDDELFLLVAQPLVVIVEVEVVLGRVLLHILALQEDLPFVFQHQQENESRKTDSLDSSLAETSVAFKSCLAQRIRNEELAGVGHVAPRLPRHDPPLLLSVASAGAAHTAATGRSRAASGAVVAAMVLRAGTRLLIGCIICIAKRILIIALRAGLGKK